MTATECPTAQTLHDFLLGRLEPPTLDHCENHVADCPNCHETLRGLNDSDDTLGAHIQSALADESDRGSLDSATVDRLVEQLSELSVSTSLRVGQEPVVDAEAGSLDLEMLADRAAEVLRCLQPEQDSLGRLGDYRLVRLVGAGSSGVVFQAVDEKLNRDVALKVLRPSLGPVARERFLVEAQAAASIDHTNVVSIFQVGEQDRLAFLAMQWSPGETLERRLERQSVLEPDEVRWIATEIASGLGAAHRQQMIHRDIKPANIWLCEHERALRILDFGLARVTDDDPGLTATGMLAGTPNYMSPEQARGMELDGRSDLFSLGGLMYRMLTGRLPFGAPTVLGTLQAVQHHQPIPVQALRPEVDDDLSDLTMALLEKQPSDRIPNAALVKEMLHQPREAWTQPVNRYQFAEPTETLETKPAAQNQPQSKLASGNGSRTWLRWLTLAMLLALAAGGFIFRQQIIRIMTDKGELIVRTDDPNVKVEILKNGQQVMILDEVTGQGVDIESGKYQLRASGTSDSDEQVEFTVEPSILTMTRGGKQVVQIERVEPASTPESRANNVDQATYRLGPNDILGVFIEGVLGEVGEVPIANIPLPGGNTLPSTGYAVPIRSDGTLSLPLVDPIDVKGMTVAEAEARVKQAYRGGPEPILKPRATIIVTLVQTESMRNASGVNHVPFEAPGIGRSGLGAGGQPGGAIGGAPGMIGGAPGGLRAGGGRSRLGAGAVGQPGGGSAKGMGGGGLPGGLGSGGGGGRSGLAGGGRSGLGAGAVDSGGRVGGLGGAPGGFAGGSGPGGGLGAGAPGGGRGGAALGSGGRPGGGMSSGGLGVGEPGGSGRNLPAGAVGGGRPGGGLGAGAGGQSGGGAARGSVAGRGIVGSGSAGQSITPDSAFEYPVSPNMTERDWLNRQIHSLELEMMTLDSEMAQQEKQYGKDHPALKFNVEKIQQMELRRRELRRRLDQENGDSSHPTYNGREFSQWLRIAQTDRHPQTFAEALSACAELAETDAERKQLLEIIETAAQRYGSISYSAEDVVLSSALLALRTLPPDQVIDFMVDQLSNKNERAWRFCIWIDADATTMAPGGNAPTLSTQYVQGLRKGYVEHAEFLVDWALESDHQSGPYNIGGRIFGGTIHALTHAASDAENPAEEYPSVVKLAAKLDEQLETLDESQQISLLPLFAAVQLDSENILSIAEESIRDQKTNGQLRQQWLAAYELLTDPHRGTLRADQGSFFGDEPISWKNDRRVEYLASLLEYEAKPEVELKYLVSTFGQQISLKETLLQMIYQLLPNVSEDSKQKVKNSLQAANESEEYIYVGGVSDSDLPNRLKLNLSVLIKMCDGADGASFQSVPGYQGGGSARLGLGGEFGGGFGGRAKNRSEQGFVKSGGKPASDGVDEPTDGPSSKRTVEPVFGGKNFAQWLTIAKTDRQPKAFTEALSACAELAETEAEQEQLLEIIELAARRYQQDKYKPEEKEKIEVVKSALGALATVPGRKVAEFVVRQLESGRTNGIRFVAGFDSKYWPASEAGMQDLAQAFSDNAEFLLSWSIRTTDDPANTEDADAMMFRWQIRDSVIDLLIRGVRNAEHPSKDFPQVVRVMAKCLEEIDTLSGSHQFALLPLFAALDIKDDSILTAVENRILDESVRGYTRERWLQTYVFLKPRYRSGYINTRGDAIAWSDDRRLKFVEDILQDRDWERDEIDLSGLRAEKYAIENLMRMIYALAPLASTEALQQVQDTLVEVSESNRFRRLFGPRQSQFNIDALIKFCDGKTDVTYQSIFGQHEALGHFKTEGGIFGGASD